MLGTFTRTVVVVAVAGFVLHKNWSWTFPEILVNAFVVIIAIAALWRIFSSYSAEL